MKGFTYDGTHSDSFKLLMTGKRVPILPPFKEHFEAIPGKDGVWDFGVEYDARPIEIDVDLLADSVAELKTLLRQIGAYFNPRKGARPLIFDDEPGMVYYARLTGQLPLEQIGQYGKFTLQLICPDPFVYSITGESISGTGTVYLPHNGSYYAYPTFTITHGGGSGNITVTRADGVVQTLTFKDTAPAGTYIVNSKAGTITMNNEGAYKYLQGDFPTLSEGSNTLEYAGNVTVEYKHTFL